MMIRKGEDDDDWQWTQFYRQYKDDTDNDYDYADYKYRRQTI